MQPARLLPTAGTPSSNPAPAKKGFLRKALDAFGYVFLGKDPWLTGGTPLTPKEPVGEPPRRFQYPPGTNIQIQPRATEELSFAQLRGLGEYTLVRLVIERVKESLKAHEWDIVAAEPGMGVSFEADIKAVKTYFERPDKRHAWDEWLGLLLEDVLVIDALSIYRHRTYDGRIWAHEIVDGATVKVLCDSRGFEPLPPFPAYQQFLYGVPYVNMTKDELIYRPRNRRANKFYGFSAVEQIAIVVNMGIRRELYDLAQFTDGNMPAGVAGLPEDWTPEMIQQFQQYWDSILSGNMQSRSKIKFVPAGFDFTKFQDDEVFGLFSKFDEWLARIVCFAFGVSPQSFVQMMNRAVAQEAGDQEAEYGLQAVKLYVERLINDIIDNDLMLPHLQFNWITDRGRMQQKRVLRNKEYVGSAIYTPNEVREEEGKPPLPGGDLLYFNGQPLGSVAAGGAPGSGIVSPEMTPEPGLGDGNEVGIHEPIGEGAMGTEEAFTESLAYSALAKARQDELSQWERWAAARLEKLEKVAAGFKTKFIGKDEAALIAADLQKSKTIDQIKHIFARRKAAIPPMRLRPPEARDAAHRVGDLKTQLRAVLGREAERVAGRIVS